MSQIEFDEDKQPPAQLIELPDLQGDLGDTTRREILDMIRTALSAPNCQVKQAKVDDTTTLEITTPDTTITIIQAITNNEITSTTIEKHPTPPGALAQEQGYWSERKTANVDNRKRMFIPKDILKELERRGIKPTQLFMYRKLDDDTVIYALKEVRRPTGFNGPTITPIDDQGRIKVPHPGEEVAICVREPLIFILPTGAPEPGQKAIDALYAEKT